MPNELQVLEFDTSKLELIKRTVAKGATQDEFELFLHACKRTGLDPLMKQIHAIKRWSAAEGRETMAIQTGIDGYRLVAERTGKYAGSDEPLFEIQEGSPYPSKATVTVWKIVEGTRYPFTASAHWEEYVQKKKDGTITSFWQRMPKGQLGKCAESLALRKAFPAELSGVYTHEEMMQADERPHPMTPQIPQVRPKQDATEVDRYTGEPRQEDGVDSRDASLETAGLPRPTILKGNDAPAPKSAAEFAKNMADKMDDQYEDGLIGNLQPYTGMKAYQTKAKPGYFDLEDGQGGLIRKFKYFDPEMDLTSGMKRVYYRTENYQGKVSFTATKIEALE